jgi:hypothetical protein
MKDELLITDLVAALKWALGTTDMEPYNWVSEEGADAHYKALDAIARAERRTLPDALAAVTAVAQSIQE